MTEFNTIAVRKRLAEMDGQARLACALGADLPYSAFSRMVDVANVLIDVVENEQKVNAELRERLRQADRSFERRVAANMAEVFGR